MGAVVPEDLSVFPVNISLRQSAQAVQEVGVQHQIVGPQHVLGQFQLGLGPDEAVGLEERWRSPVSAPPLCVHGEAVHKRSLTLPETRRSFLTDLEYLALL